MTTKKVTYEDYGNLSGESVLTFDQALDLFNLLTWNKGSFFYFEINPKYLFQVTWDKTEQFLIEITDADDDEMICLQKFAEVNEVKELIEYFFDSEDISILKGFYKVPVLTKTLTEVMNAAIQKN